MKKKPDWDALLMQLFNTYSTNQSKRKYFKSQKALALLLSEEAEKRGYEETKVSQPTVNRILQRHGIKNINGYYSQDEKIRYENSIESLTTAFRRYTHPNAELVPNVRLAVLQTKQYYNQLLAKKIKATFDEVLLTTYPTDRHILILYKADAHNRLESVFKKIQAERGADNDNESVKGKRKKTVMEESLAAMEYAPEIETHDNDTPSETLGDYTRTEQDDHIQ